MNIQDFPSAIILTNYTSLHQSGNKDYVVYCVPDKGMLYTVDKDGDGTILSQKYILDISFEKIGEDDNEDTEDYDMFSDLGPIMW